MTTPTETANKNLRDINKSLDKAIANAIRDDAISFERQRYPTFANIFAEFCDNAAGFLQNVNSNILLSEISSLTNELDLFMQSIGVIKENAPADANTPYPVTNEVADLLDYWRLKYNNKQDIVKNPISKTNQNQQTTSVSDLNDFVVTVQRLILNNKDDIDKNNKKHNEYIYCSIAILGGLKISITALTQIYSFLWIDSKSPYSLLSKFLTSPLAGSGSNPIRGESVLQQFSQSTSANQSTNISDAETYLFEAKTYSNKKQYDQAGQAYSSAGQEYESATENDKAAQAYSNAGQAYSSANENDKAGTDYSNAGDAYNKEGNEKKDDEAIKAYNNAGDAYNNAGDAYNKAGKYDKGKKAYDQAGANYHLVGLSNENKGAKYDEVDPYGDAGDAYSKAGDAFNNASEYDKAGKAYNAAVKAYKIARENQKATAAKIAAEKAEKAKTS